MLAVAICTPLKPTNKESLVNLVDMEVQSILSKRLVEEQFKTDHNLKLIKEFANTLQDISDLTKFAQTKIREFEEKIRMEWEIKCKEKSEVSSKNVNVAENKALVNEIEQIQKENVALEKEIDLVKEEIQKIEKNESLLKKKTTNNATLKKKSNSTEEYDEGKDYSVYQYN